MRLFFFPSFKVIHMVVAAHSELFEVISESPYGELVIVVDVTITLPYDSWYSFQETPATLSSAESLRWMD